MRSSTLALIGGTPRCGKTTLSRRIADLPSYAWSYSLDVIHGSLARLQPDRWDVDQARLPAAQELSPLFRLMARASANDPCNSVYEGAMILPEDVTWLQDQGVSVRCVFLIWTKPDLSNILEHSDPDSWFPRQAREVQLAGLQDVANFSAYLKSECIRRELPYLDRNDGRFSDQLDQAFVLLASD